MSKLEQLVRRFEYTRQQWLKSFNKEAEDGWYKELVSIEKEIKSYKARKCTYDIGSSVMANYIEMNKNKSQKGK